MYSQIRFVMPAIFDFDLTLTRENTFPSRCLEVSHELTDEAQYAEGKKNGETNIKHGLASVLLHDHQNLSAVATDHNNPKFVAGSISAILKKELTLLKTIRRRIVTNVDVHSEKKKIDMRFDIAVDIYKVEGVDKPFLISYIPYTGETFSLVTDILLNKNVQIRAIRDVWLKQELIKTTDAIDFYEDTQKNFKDGMFLDYLNGYLVNAQSDAFVVQCIYKSLANQRYVGMLVLSGFITVFGIAAIALVYTVTFPVLFLSMQSAAIELVVTGVTGLLLGSGLFANALFNKKSFYEQLDPSPDIAVQNYEAKLPAL
jgi:hypothetical protein